MNTFKKVLGLAIGVGVSSVVVGNALVFLYGAGIKFPVRAESKVEDENIYSDIVTTPFDNSYFFGKTENYSNLSANQTARMQKEEEIMANVTKVKAFYEKYKAPMASSAEFLVRYSAKMGVDYRLIVAISIVESGGGVVCFRPYNPFGWGNLGYTSFEEAIATVVNGIAKGYYAKGLTTPALMAPVYNPVTPEAWAQKITNIMNSL
ncbi:glucosaminidase domain-containing protein [Candidatus Dojkabacteria bacterium]|nr:glucosaminidase domain-containing protein [Candidatus Dojkabacteria bacterium]